MPDLTRLKITGKGITEKLKGNSGYFILHILFTDEALKIPIETGSSQTARGYFI
jgi:hypothetical protein